MTTTTQTSAIYPRILSRTEKEETILAKGKLTFLTTQRSLRYQPRKSKRKFEPPNPPSHLLKTKPQRKPTSDPRVRFDSCQLPSNQNPRHCFPSSQKLERIPTDEYKMRLVCE